MADFTPIYKFTKLAEGGYQKFSNDSANYNSNGDLVGTNHGIGAKTYESFLGRSVTEGDMRAMKPEVAKAIFKRNFWDKIKGDEIQNQAVAHVIFQEFIGSGYAGLKRVREVINKVAGKKVLSESAISFQNTPEFIPILSKLDANKLYQSIVNNAIDARFSIVRNSPSKANFLRGWMNRWKKLDSSHTGNPLYSDRWKKIDERLKGIGLKPTAFVASNAQLYNAAFVGIGLLSALGTFFF